MDQLLSNGWIVVLYAISSVMLAGVAVSGASAFMRGLQTPDERARYISLPILLPAMAGSIAINILWPSVTLYLVTGALWGLTFPLRLVVRAALAEKQRPTWAPIRDWKLWLLAPCLAAVHAPLWPLSIPVGHWLSREIGMR